MNIRTQSGFTLLELLIVLTIIGILAAVAIPGYQNFTARGQLTESLSLLDGAKFAVEEYVSQSGSFPLLSTNLTTIGVQTSGKYVSSITVNSVSGSLGELQAQFHTNDVSSGISGKTVLMRRLAQGQWACVSGGTDAVHKKYLPTACKN